MALIHAVCYREAAVTVSRQVALIFSEDSSQAAQSQDGVPLNNRTVPETHTEHQEYQVGTHRSR